MRPPDGFETVLRANLTIAPDQPLDYQVPLADYGLDSLTAVNVVVDLEEHFHIVFPDDRIMIATFHSTQSLWETLSDLLTERGAWPVDTSS